MADAQYEDAAERMEGDVERGGARRRGGKGGRGRRGGRGADGGGGGGGGDQNREFLLSKALSTLLRHQAAAAGIQLDAEGFAPLDKVVSLFGGRPLSYLESNSTRWLGLSARFRCCDLSVHGMLTSDNSSSGPAYAA